MCVGGIVAIGTDIKSHIVGGVLTLIDVFIGQEFRTTFQRNNGVEPVMILSVSQTVDIGFAAGIRSGSDIVEIIVTDIAGYFAADNRACGICACLLYNLAGKEIGADVCHLTYIVDYGRVIIAIDRRELGQ